MSNTVQIKGPFLTRPQAANYLGYKDTYFQKLLGEYHIPRHGPAKTRFAQSVLDAFMAYPEAFKKQKRSRSRKPKLLTV